MTTPKRAPTVVWRDFVCDNCGMLEDTEGHDDRPEGGPWAVWCANQLGDDWRLLDAV